MIKVLKIIVIIGVVGFCSPAICQAKDWQTIKDRHFTVNYRPEVPEEFANTVMDSAEDNYRSVIDNLGISWHESWASEKPVLIYIYRDAQDYTQSGGQAGWSHGAALITTKTIRTYPSDEGFFDALLPHELGHIILREYIGLQTPVPLWFDEGVAMFQEKAKRVNASKFVKDAMLNGQFIALTQLSDMRLYMNSDRQQVELFYAESASVVNFLMNEFGRNRFLKLCEQLKASVSFNEAFSIAYPSIDTLENLNKKWVNNLRDH